MPDGMMAELTSGGDVRIRLPRSVLKDSSKGPNDSLILELSRQNAVTLRDILDSRLGGDASAHQA